MHLRNLIPVKVFLCDDHFDGLLFLGVYLLFYSIDVYTDVTVDCTYLLHVVELVQSHV